MRLGRSPVLQTIPTLPEISSRADDDQCFELIKNWIGICSREHQCCVMSTPSVLPKRVVHVGSCQTSPFLYESKGEQGAYLALSHCWGTSQPFTTERSTIEQRKACIHWDSLPKTFQDAIIVARKLGVSYLWIDSLCIIQDDLEDWQVESSQMAKIYANAHMTIAALSASSDTAGFISSRGYPSSMLSLPSGNETDPPSHVGVRRTLHLHNSGPLSGPLFERAWTYQERLLSRRVVYYSDQEISWECREATYCECSSYKPLTSSWEDDFSMRLHQAYAILHGKESRVKFTSSHDIYDWWRHSAVSDFRRRKLTKESDRLPALSGLASAFQALTGDTYLGGLWAGDLLHGLLWISSENGRLPPEYRAPTWAWPSVDGEAGFIIEGLGKRNQNISWFSKTIAASCSPAGSDPTGAVKGGHTTLYGPVTHSELRISDLQDGQTAKSQLVYELFVKDEPVESKQTIYIHRPNYLSPSFSPDTVLVGGDGLLAEGEIEDTVESEHQERGKVKTQRTVRRSRLLPDDPRPAVRGTVLLLLLMSSKDTSRSADNSSCYRFLVLGRSTTVAGAFERIGLLTFIDFPWEHHGRDIYAVARMTEVTIV
jgi:hypothetical protein